MRDFSKNILVSSFLLERADMTRIRPEKTIHLKCDGVLCFRSVDKDLRQIKSGLG